MKHFSFLFLFLVICSMSTCFGQSNVPKSTAEDTTKRKSQPVSGDAVDVIEDEPTFPNGEEALQKFIKDNLVYPAEAKANGEQGKVYVRFVVEKDGSITNVSIARGVTPSLDAEALRVVQAMPNWSPGKQRGKPVRTNVVIPIVFKL